MAVKIKFDNSHNVIPPTLSLATRDGRKLGYIPAVNVSVSDAFNTNFELEFQVHKIENGKKYAYWDDITDFKLCWCREWDVWFEMSVEVQDEDNNTKNVSCISLGEAELSQIMLYNIEINTEDDIDRDDYKATVLYYAEDTQASLLHRIMEKAPHYSIKHVDSTISKIQRTFSFNNLSLYDAFQKIAEEIDCIFVINSGSNDDGSISRSISVYDLQSNCLECGNRDIFTGKCPKCGSTNVLNGYGEDTCIYVSTENLAESISLKTDTDSVKNCFRLEAGDDDMTATIRNCNPNGSQYIWYISEDMKKDMSDELVARLNGYSETYSYYQKEHKTILDSKCLEDYNNLVEKYRKYDEDLKSVPQNIIGYSQLMNVYYDTIDMYLLLNDELMPSPKLSDTTAASQATYLNANMLSTVAVQDLNKASLSTISNTVLSVAKTIVDSRYQVKIKDSSLNDRVWTGNFTITNYSDDSDTVDTAPIKVNVNDNYELFVRQKLDKILNDESKSKDVSDISSLFKLSLDEFNSEIKKYCLSRLNTFRDACQSCIDILIEQGVSNNDTSFTGTSDLYTSIYVPYYQKMLSLQDEVNLRESEIAMVVGTYDESDGSLTKDGLQTIIESKRSEIQNILNMENYIGESLWLEFVSYRREDTYSNDNYISDGLNNTELFDRALEFIEAAQKEIYKSATLQHSISATLKNLLVMKEFQPIVDYFSVGNWIHIRIDNEIFRLRLISYEIDFDDLENIDVEFSDVMKCVTGVTDTESILNQASSMATSFDSVSRQASQGKKSNEKLQDWVNKGLALTKMKIIDNANNQDIMWDYHGLLCREYLPFTDAYSDKQLKIINRGLYLTDDAWKTSKAGIGDFTFYNPETGNLEEAYGVIADVLVGNIVLSQKVGIYTMDNSITLSKDGFKIISDEQLITEFKNDGTFSLGKDNIKFDGEKLTISPNVEITWSQITGTDNIASTGDIPTKLSELLNDAGFQNLEEVTDKATQITKDMISVPYLDTLGITAKAVKSDWVYSGKIVADQITSGSITSNNGLTVFDLDNGVITSSDGDVKETIIKNGDIKLYDRGDITIIKSGRIELTDNGETGTKKVVIDREGFIEVFEDITVGGKSVSLEGHTHGNYATTTALNGKLSTSGGTISGALSVTGKLRFRKIQTDRHTKNDTGYSFLIYNGDPEWIDSNVDSVGQSTYVYIAGGADDTGIYLRSYPMYSRTYSNAANVHVTSSGTLGRSSSSSIRYKNSVQYLSNLENSAIDSSKIVMNTTDRDLLSVLDIPVVKFRYNSGYMTGEPDYNYDKDVVGFIADDVATICPDCATYIPDENGELIPESWDERQIIPRMLYVIQILKKENEKLQNDLRELTQTVSQIM